MIIGICGKSGSGKTTLASNLTKLNNSSVHLNIDLIGHKVLEIPEVKEALVSEFGMSVSENHKIDRKKLGSLVFNSRHEAKKLSDIVWKYMEEDIDAFLNANKDKTIILDWLLLPLTKYFNMCDIKILLDTPMQIRKERAIKRDGIKESEFILREKASIEYDNNSFNYIIKTNNRELEESL